MCLIKSGSIKQSDADGVFLSTPVYVQTELYAQPHRNTEIVTAMASYQEVMPNNTADCCMLCNDYRSS